MCVSSTVKSSLGHILVSLCIDFAAGCGMLMLSTFWSIFRCYCCFSFSPYIVSVFKTLEWSDRLDHYRYLVRGLMDYLKGCTSRPAFLGQIPFIVEWSNFGSILAGVKFLKPLLRILMQNDRRINARADWCADCDKPMCLGTLICRHILHCHVLCPLQGPALVRIQACFLPFTIWHAGQSLQHVGKSGWGLSMLCPRLQFPIFLHCIIFVDDDHIFHPASRSRQA